MDFPRPAGISTYHTTTYPAIDVTRPELSTAEKTVFITGGGSGLGLSFAQHFAKAGCTRLAITGRRPNVLKDAKDSLEKDYPGLKVLVLQSDVKSKAAVESAFHNTHSTFGKIDILINNAAYLPTLLPITSSDVGEWWSGFETNVLGSFHILSSFVSVSAYDAVIINLVSAAVNTVAPEHSAYSASKVASTRLFECFARENPEYRVVNVAPGFVLTEMGNKAFDAMGAMGLPELPVDDISLPASYLVWAASPEAAYLKGKFIWVHWDVDELRQVVEKVEDEHIFRLGVHGMPNISM